MRPPSIVVLSCASACLLATLSCRGQGTSGTVPASDGGTSEACVHPLKDLPEDQREGTLAAATSSALTKMASADVGGQALVGCPLEGASAAPRVIVAHCGGVRSVMWSPGPPGAEGGGGATSYFDVSGKLSAYRQETADPAGYTCGGGRTMRVAVYGSVPTCQPWTEQRYCAPSSAPR
jgi:hypothetical protein